ncbi:serine palmitoyltransferase 1-like [Tribolium madens]|uniref:serine palmitoyltransferase 1-like n=1 Tax=Tribolium madens TaxID=41895 RepID=UPI001CF765F3|nr:serine palmitoyltransferase 1-like [Tribolium madens]XP_044260097.1 serine palmitoyltransferase 1-like [Tribolium madens]XP_044260098.1 serine palmitoyltransferase 1-like [Tribolium madens]XP_044260099.1 serine palmitoyltransferase 1-like [Tribolium madens]
MFDEVLFEQRLRDFNPEPLITPIGPQDEPLELHMVIEDEKNIDLAKANYLNLLNSEEIKKISEKTIKEFGVGTCGPRAFYGTTEIHLELEERLARFLHMEESIIYSYGFVTISSAVAACCKQTDVVFVDEFTNVPIWQGLKAARSRIIKFSHNDPCDFHQKACSVTNCHKFLIIEGVSWNTGKLCPLPAFLQVAERFKIRVFLEESYTLGVFGATGRGLTEYYRIEPSRIDMIMGTFERALGSIGGFCAGSFSIISQQQVAGSGYIFSASLPTYLVEVVLKGLELMGDKPVKFARLAVKFHRFLEECEFEVASHPEAPFKLVKLATKWKAQLMHEFCRDKGVHFIRNENELVINLNVSLMDDENKLGKVFEALKEAADLVN